MQSKRITFFALLLIISLVYAWLSLFVFEDDFDKSGSYNIGKLSQTPSTAANHASNQYISLPKPLEKKSNLQALQVQEISLPAKFLVMGIALETDDQQSLVLIEHKGGLIEYEQYDYLLDTDMQLMAIRSKEIDVEYKKKTFTISLTPPNLLAPDYRKPSKSQAEFLEMTPEQIGTRPRILEHMFVLTSTPYIADGKLVNPGLNPALFKNAGFKHDDVLKTINGKSVTIEEDIEAIKKELLTAQTLTFKVMRKGRMITLYLDIPSEALKLSID